MPKYVHLQEFGNFFGGQKKSKGPQKASVYYNDHTSKTIHTKNNQEMQADHDDPYTVNDWVVLQGRTAVRFIRNPKNNKVPKNWQKSSKETEVMRIFEAQKRRINLNGVNGK